MATCFWVILVWTLVAVLWDRACQLLCDCEPMMEVPIDSLIKTKLCLAKVRKSMRGYGATAARLTPDQKVGSSNLSGLIFLARSQRCMEADIFLVSAACILMRRQVQG